MSDKSSDAAAAAAVRFSRSFESHMSEATTVASDESDESASDGEMADDFPDTAGPSKSYKSSSVGVFLTDEASDSPSSTKVVVRPAIALLWTRVFRQGLLALSLAL